MEELVEFTASIPDFRRTCKGNIRHKLSDIILLMVMARISGCTGRTEIIEFGKYNLKRFQSMGNAGARSPFRIHPVPCGAGYR